MVEERVSYVRAVPEQDAAEIVEVSPGPGSVYVSGHWEWNGASYAWVRAHYLRRPQPNLFWVEAHWQNTPKGWYWQEGHWTDMKTRPPFLHPHAKPAPAPADEPQESAQPSDGELESDPNVPPAPSYAPPPPPANIPPPPGATGQPQHYLRQPSPSVGY
jgi:hypothetical protein